MRTKDKHLREALVVLIAPILTGLACSLYYRDRTPLYFILLNGTVPMLILGLLTLIGALIYRRRLRRW